MFITNHKYTRRVNILAVYALVVRLVVGPNRLPYLNFAIVSDSVFLNKLHHVNVVASNYKYKFGKYVYIFRRDCYFYIFVTIMLK